LGKNALKKDEQNHDRLLLKEQQPNQGSILFTIQTSEEITII